MGVAFKKQSYELNLYRKLMPLRKSIKDIDLVAVSGGHVSLTFKNGRQVKWHLNSFGLGLIGSLGEPTELSPAGYGIRWTRVDRDTGLCFKVIESQG